MAAAYAILSKVGLAGGTKYRARVAVTDDLSEGNEARTMGVVEIIVKREVYNALSAGQKTALRALNIGNIVDASYTGG